MRTRWVVLLVLATNLLTLAIVFGVRWYDDNYRFDAAKWHARQPGDCNDEHRWHMVEDLGENYLDVGMTRADVLWLLGPPDLVEEAPGGPRALLGWDTGLLASDCEYFYVNFGRGGKTVVEWGDGGD
jgi:hypothetical protein